MTSQTPCTACSWTPERQAYCRYHSNVKLFYECSDRGIWSIGSELILKERGNNPPSFEAQNLRFVKEKTSIPVPTVIAEWEEDNERYFMIITRVPGKPLNEVWSTLRNDEKHKLAKQAVNYLRELRDLQAPRMEGLGGEPVWDNPLFGDEFRASHGPMSSDNELWTEMEKALSTVPVPERARQRLWERMPTAAPCTFTHGDMNLSNFMVKNGHLTGIIDWELSGYFPVWRESVGALISMSIEDLEWKKLLLQHMPVHADACEFFIDLYCVRHPYDIETRERARKLFEDLN